MAMPWYGQDADRLQAADFSFPFLYAGIAIQTHRPQPSLDWRSIFKPFSLLVWLVTLASVMSIVIFLLLSFKVEKLSLFEGLYLAFVPTLKQGLMRKRAMSDSNDSFLNRIEHLAKESNFIRVFTSLGHTSLNIVIWQVTDVEVVIIILLH